jgi:hypothetical protein
MTPKEIELLVRLKYGPITYTPEFLRTLPDCVIDEAFDRLSGILAAQARIGITPSQEQKMRSLALNLCLNSAESERVVIDSLITYHSLLGTM